MKVKGVISEERITLPELRESLLEMEGQRSGEGKEMSYELRRSIEHSNQLAKNTPEQSRMLAGELLKLEKMKPDIAFRITNIMPRTRDELRAIYAKEKYSLTPEELDAILSLVEVRS